MRNFIRVIVIFLTVLSTGCTAGNVVQDSNTVEQNEPVEYDLHDVLISVNGRRETNNVEFNTSYELYYDEEARVIAEKGSEIYNSNKSYFERYFEYDNGNNLIEKLHYYVGYGSYILTSYTYLDDLMMAKEEYSYIYKTDEESIDHYDYTYDDNGNLIKEHYYLGDKSNDYSKEYFYDDDLLIEEILYNGDLRHERARRNYEYDDKGNVIKAYYKNKLEKSYFYENNLLIREETPLVNSSHIITYEYDDKDRLIKREWCNKQNDGTVTAKEIREYVYGDTNISDGLEYPVLEKNNKAILFTNKYGTPTTICAHKGCDKYIASSGDTNCCEQHSKRCLKCNCYIDEDAMYCMDCLKKYFGG